MAKVTVHAMDAGHLTLPEWCFVKPSDQDATRFAPSLSFLIQHTTARTKTTTRLVFDLGLRRDLSLYPAALEAHCTTRAPIRTTPDVLASLAQGGVTVDDIDYVIFSHVHYDHVGFPKDFTSKKTQFVIGPGSSDLLSGRISLHGAHSIFEADLLPLQQTWELPSTALSRSVRPLDSSLDGPLRQDVKLDGWKPLPPFSHSIDIFSDSSVYIVSAPGHIPGHINLLARTSLSPLKYVLLAGDACHDIRLFQGTHEIATWTDNEGHQCCIHTDIPQAYETIQRLRTAVEEGIYVDVQGFNGAAEKQKAEVEVVFAHDWQWETDARTRGRFLPGQL